MCSLQLFNWRRDMGNWVDKFGHILSTGLFADVSFSVGSSKEVIEGHKVFLMAGSPFFQQLFEGKKDKKVIEISQIEPKEFKQVLKYLYTGDKGYKNDVDFDPMAFLKALKYFEVEELYEESSNDLMMKISAQNALQIYVESKNNLKMDQLSEDSEIFIMENANEILDEPSFLTLSMEILENFLASNNFWAEEVQICLAVYKWGEAECLRQKLEKTDENLREVLKRIIPLIRFPTMKRSTLSMQISPLNILKPDQLIRILNHLNIPPAHRQSDEKLGFISRPRTKKTLLSTPNFDFQECHTRLLDLYKDEELQLYNNNRFVRFK